MSEECHAHTLASGMIRARLSHPLPLFLPVMHHCRRRKLCRLVKCSEGPQALLGRSSGLDEAAVEALQRSVAPQGRALTTSRQGDVEDITISVQTQQGSVWVCCTILGASPGLRRIRHYSRGWCDTICFNYIQESVCWETSSHGLLRSTLHVWEALDFRSEIPQPS